MYPLWTFLHGFVLLAGTGALAVAVLLQRRRVERSRAAASVALLLVIGALVAVPVELGVLLALASYGPDFALEKIPLGVPLALVPLVAAVAVPSLSRAAVGQDGPRAAGVLAVRVALVAQLLAWHLFLVPPTSRVAVLGTGLAYVAVLIVSVPLLRPRGPRPAPSTGRGRAARIAGGVTYSETSRSASSAGRARNGQWSPGSSTGSGTAARAQSASMIRSSAHSTYVAGAAAPAGTGLGSAVIRQCCRRSRATAQAARSAGLSG